MIKPQKRRSYSFKIPALTQPLGMHTQINVSVWSAKVLDLSVWPLGEWWWSSALASTPQTAQEISAFFSKGRRHWPTRYPVRQMRPKTLMATRNPNSHRRRFCSGIIKGHFRVQKCFCNFFFFFLVGGSEWASFVKRNLYMMAL